MERLLIATKSAKVYSTDEAADATGLDKVDFINVKTDGSVIIENRKVITLADVKSLEGVAIRYALF
ncbi:hypothetical protein E0712_09060 [Lactobacillus helveticus]|uniref:hypothetical protein n=1 Tax=Lactobacillus helveticus TaxID=1587 RepID=UPI001C645E03|nr:hypothetical protein [Lactobacillus helveticus]MBW8014501.1 hypothetical protein [Lactobacillus helveticus]